MFTKRFTACVAVLAGAASLALPGAAGATATPAAARTIQQVYPVAEQLCTELADGHGEARLREHARRVLSGCAALRSAYADAHALYLQAASLTPSVNAELPAASVRCGGRARSRAHRACARARVAAEAVLDRLRAKRGALFTTANAELAAARVSFWSMLRALAPAKPAVRRARRVVVKRVVVVVDVRVRSEHAAARRRHRKHAHR
ncbi:MAG TPA: hypothetical protein VMF09_09865 [Solirubrobacteraceae bacterium]|nr:hypothetical protein [Solirubrobacteraceae bacterium]